MGEHSADHSDVSCNYHSDTSRAGGASASGAWTEAAPHLGGCTQAVAAAGVLLLPELINHTLTGLHSRPAAGGARLGLVWGWGVGGSQPRTHPALVLPRAPSSCQKQPRL